MLKHTSGKEDQHRAVDHSNDQLPLFACDYAFLKSETDETIK